MSDAAALTQHLQVLVALVLLGLIANRVSAAVEYLRMIYNELRILNAPRRTPPPS